MFLKGTPSVKQRKGGTYIRVDNIVMLLLSECVFNFKVKRRFIGGYIALLGLLHFLPHLSSERKDLS